VCFVILLPVWWIKMHIKYFSSLPVNCGRFCFWRRQCVVFVRKWNISGTAKRICAKFTRTTWLVPRSDEFEGQCQRSRSAWTKRHSSVISAACMRFMFGKTSVACSAYCGEWRLSASANRASGRLSHTSSTHGDIFKNKWQRATCATNMSRILVHRLQQTGYDSWYTSDSY